MEEEENVESPLNDLAWDLVHQILSEADELRVQPVAEQGAGVVLDFGVEADGSLSAGLALAEVCMAGLCQLSIVPGTVGGIGWPTLFVQTDNPLEACLLSQYAGWQISLGKYFAMGSGPMRAAALKEPLFEELDYSETGYGVVGVLESSRLPSREVVEYIAKTCRVAPDQVALLVAPTSSIAGNLQVVARSVETAMHKLHEVGFDVLRVESACGSAPISPVAADDLTGVGRTNDAILYGGRVTLYVTGDDESIAEIGPRVPSSGSAAYGKPFLELFEAAGRDFYQLDPLLFSPAEVVFQNLETGRVHVFGSVNESILRSSFGI
ncbi:methenyltetrahydromethanopterin cyclohydrolase [Planctomicrobium sp. SH664]|uniref:methenyltetrahydromethanopterin cyclohydrolase n=1 Tax=Planctomicrobium sp. SH664 TaxID=3448125 RepID=UPI003F5B5373